MDCRGWREFDRIQIGEVDASHMPGLAAGDRLPDAEVDLSGGSRHTNLGMTTDAPSGMPFTLAVMLSISLDIGTDRWSKILADEETA